MRRCQNRCIKKNSDQCEKLNLSPKRVALIQGKYVTSALQFKGYIGTVKVFKIRWEMKDSLRDKHKKGVKKELKIYFVHHLCGVIKLCIIIIRVHRSQIWKSDYDLQRK